MLPMLAHRKSLGNLKYIISNFAMWMSYKLIVLKIFYDIVMTKFYKLWKHIHSDPTQEVRNWIILEWMFLIKYVQHRKSVWSGMIYLKMSFLLLNKHAPPNWYVSPFASSIFVLIVMLFPASSSFHHPQMYEVVAIDHPKVN